MKTFLILISAVLLIGCKGGSGGAATQSETVPDAAPEVTSPDNSNPSNNSPSFTMTGIFDKDQAANSYAPCPACIKSCTENQYGGYSCSYQSYLPPAACTMTMIGGLELSNDMTQANTWSFYVRNVGYQIGSPYINWNVGGPRNISVSGNTITFTDLNYSVEVHELDSNNIVVDFGGGCAIAFKAQ